MAMMTQSVFVGRKARVGNFYGNVTLLGTNLEAVRAVAPRPALMFTDGDAVVLFAQADDEGALTTGAGLSAALGCVAFSAGVHDDDIFFFEVHDHGRAVMSGAVPDPVQYFDLDKLAELDPAMLEEPRRATTPESGRLDPDALVRALGRGDVEAVRSALEAEYVFASERHQAIAEGLTLPTGAVGWGYRYLAADTDDYAGPALTEV